MLLEAAGTATAAAGGLVLRQAFKTTNTRTATVHGNFTGILDQGDTGGNKTTSFGTPPASTANATASGASPGRKPAAGIIIGCLLIAAGILMICAGLYWNREMSRV